MRLQRTRVGLVVAVLSVFGTSGVAAATHAGSDPSAAPQDFSSGSFKGELPSFGTTIHARHTAHLPAVQPSAGSFDVHGEAVATLEGSSGERTQHRGDLLCGMVDGTSAFLLYTLREPVPTGFGPARHMALMVFDNGQPSQEPPDQVAVSFIVFGGSPPEESGQCSMVGVVFDHTRGNVVVHDSEG